MSDGGDDGRPVAGEQGGKCDIVAKGSGSFSEIPI